MLAKSFSESSQCSRPSPRTVDRWGWRAALGICHATVRRRILHQSGNGLVYRCPCAHFFDRRRFWLAAGGLVSAGGLATVRLTAEGQGERPMFIGIGPEGAVSDYLNDLSDLRLGPYTERGAIVKRSKVLDLSCPSVRSVLVRQLSCSSQRPVGLRIE